jgi:uncharacterized repeat protein (TIGR01451 family)
MGWGHQVEPNIWTDGGSTYFELHGGVAPTFWDEATLAAGQALEWTEVWYPVSGIGHLSAATAEAALGVRESGGSFHVGVHTTALRDAGTSALYVWERNTCAELGHWDLPAVGPGEPFVVSAALPPSVPPNGGDVAFVYLDLDGNRLAAVNPKDCLPPTSRVVPLPSFVETEAFTVTWTGEDVWSGIGSYDVQVRDGYEGAWADWITDTVTTSAAFTGQHGHTYLFRARARDLQGTEEPFDDEEWGQALTTVLTQPAPVLVTSRKSTTRRYFPADHTVAYTVLISNTGNLAATAALTDTPPAELVVLTGTLTATSGPTPTYAGGAIHWTGSLPPGAEVRVTYVLSPTAATPFGVPLTNTAEITGSVLGLLTRQETVMKMHPAYLPLVARAWEP